MVQIAFKSLNMGVFKNRLNLNLQTTVGETTLEAHRALNFFSISRNGDFKKLVKFASYLNKKEPPIKFTFGKEQNHKISFLDILI